MPNIHPEIEFKSFTTKDHKTAYQIKITLNSNIAIAAKLPLVGEDLSDNALRVNALTLTYTSADSISDKEIVKGIALGGNIEIIDKKIPFSFNVNDLKETPKKFLALDSSLQSSQNRNLSTKEQAKQDTTSTFQSSEGMWLKIQKSLGPITLNRVGVSYKDGAMWLLLDSALNISVMEISLFGLGVGLPAAKLNNLDIEDLEYTLSGLEVRLNTSAVTINGGLLRVQTEEYDEYKGALIVKAGQFSLTALGSYTSWEDGTALMAFAVLNYPLGGTPCFFITGLAFGFAYNHSLRLPEINQVQNYPLIRAAMDSNASPLSLVQDMKKYMPIEVNQYWVAAGIKFTSFELATGFALATVTFGNRVEVGLLGMATISLKLDERNIIAQAELVIKARINPSEGIVSLQAELTANSYILSTDCRLTGGFAFFFWYGSNPHAGDFVITLGGYHPRFRKPDHYPIVPRLGMNMMVGCLSLKGGIYFALTPVCIMMGGSLEALWQTKVVRVWFNLYFDVLIFWKPYSYDIAVGISLGVSVELLFFTVTIQVGADLRIWGPEFSGEARIKLWIVSFTVAFGSNQQPKITAIDWNEFQQSFFATKRKEPKLPRSRFSSNFHATEKEYAVCSVNITNGILKEKEENGVKLFLVDPEFFEFSASSLVPIHEASINNEVIKPENQDWKRDFGVGLVRVDKLETSKFDVFFKHSDGKKDISEDELHNITKTPILTKMPKSMWQNIKTQEELKKAAIGDASVIDNALTMVKFKIVLRPANPEHTKEIFLDELLFHREFMDGRITYSTNDIKDKLDRKNDFSSVPLTAIKQNINQNNTYRDKTLAYMKTMKQYTTEPINQVAVEHLVSRIDNYFTDFPLQSHLGAQTLIQLISEVI